MQNGQHRCMCQRLQVKPDRQAIALEATLSTLQCCAAAAAAACLTQNAEQAARSHRDLCWRR